MRELAARGLRDGVTASRALGYQQMLAVLDGTLSLAGRDRRHRHGHPAATSAGSGPGSAATSVRSGCAPPTRSCWPPSCGTAADSLGSVTRPTAPVPFLKGHGTENDFVLIPDRDGALELDAAQVRALCDRRAGIGADGVIRIAPER